MRKETKIISALILSFFASFVLGNSVFSNFTPRLNPQFVAVLPETFSRLARSLSSFQPLSALPKTSQTLTGNTMFGMNIHSLGLLSPEEIRNTLSEVQKCNGTTVIRFWGFAGGDNIGKVLDNAPDNVKFVVTLSNFFYHHPVTAWPAPDGKETEWFQNSWKTNGMKTFVETVTNKYKGNPKILAWEIMNEPNCTADQACTDAQHEFLKGVSDIIATNDPGKLVSPGTQGQNTGGEHFDNGDFEKIISYENITAGTCHIQSDLAFSDAIINNCKTALEISKKHNRFFFVGEAGLNYGCTTQACSNSCSTDKLNERKTALLNTAQTFKEAGADAFLVWQFSMNENGTLICDGASVFTGDPLCGGETPPTSTPNPNQPTATPNPNQPTATPNPNQPTATPGPNPTNPPNPTTPPQNTPGTLEIRVHVDTEDGPLFSDNEGSVQVYIEGPSSNGHRFGEAMDVFGKAKSGCTSTGGFPYTCKAGSVLWKGANGTSGTSPGDYTASILAAPVDWEIELKDAAGTLSPNGTLTLDLVIKLEE